MVSLGEVLSLTLVQKIRLLCVFGLLEKGFAAIADLKMLSDTDGHAKSQLQSPSTFTQISLCIILLTGNSIPSEIAFLGHIYTKNCLKISYYNCCDFTFKKLSLRTQKDAP